MNKYLYILISTYSIFLVASENPRQPASFPIETSSTNSNEINQTLNPNEKKTPENTGQQPSNVNNNKDDDDSNNNYMLAFFKECAIRPFVAHLFIAADKEKKEHLKDPIGKILLKNEIEAFIPQITKFHEFFLSKESDIYCASYLNLANELLEKLTDVLKKDKQFIPSLLNARKNSK